MVRGMKQGVRRLFASGLVAEGIDELLDVVALAVGLLLGFSG